MGCQDRRPDGSRLRCQAIRIAVPFEVPNRDVGMTMGAGGNPEVDFEGTTFVS